MFTRPIRVLIIDDSAVVRRLVSDGAALLIRSIEVVGTAAGSLTSARDKDRQELNPGRRSRSTSKCRA